MTSRPGSWLSGQRIAPPPLTGGATVRDLVDRVFCAYNAARLREACRVFVEKMLQPDVTVGLAVSGALTPAGLGRSCLVPMIENGFADWIVSTGANLYHDAHFALGMDLYAGSPFVDDLALRRDGIIRIYDVLFSYDVLLDTDRFFRELARSEDFQCSMGTAEYHHQVGKYLAAREKTLGIETSSVLAAAYHAGVPVFTSSPADSSIGMNLAAARLAEENGCTLDTLRDVNQTAAIVYDATRRGESAVLILGGGSPKNFVLQTEPHIQEVLGLSDKGHSYFIQITDARPDTGGLSGATPSEAVSWGKVDPARLPDSVVCYLDTTVALPILTAYALDAHPPRPLRRLCGELDGLVEKMRADVQTLGMNGP